MKRINFSRFLPILLVTGILLGVSSCFLSYPVHQPTTQQKTTPVKKKKAHPHGQPPGQSKKGKGHPGKRH